MAFAVGLQRDFSGLGWKVSGLATFGCPRVGDAEFVEKLKGVVGDRCVRVTHAADIIPFVPPRWIGYEHPAEELYISSVGGLHRGAADLKKWHRIESFGFLPLYLYKVVNGVARGESLLRAVYRMALLVSVPGLSDHWPADYERKLRTNVVAGKVA